MLESVARDAGHTQAPIVIDGPHIVPSDSHLTGTTGLTMWPTAPGYRS